MRALQLRLERGRQGGRQHHHPVLAPLAATHDDHAALEIDILGAQLQRLGDAHAGTVEQLRQHGMRAFEQCQHRAHLGGGQHHRQARLALRAVQRIQPGQVLAEHLPVQEQQRRQRLPMRGHRHAALDGQPGQEGAHLVGAHLLGVAQTVEANEGPNPMDAGFLGSYAVVPVAHPLAQLVQQPACRRGAAGGCQRRGIWGGHHGRNCVFVQHSRCKQRRQVPPHGQPQPGQAVSLSG